MSRSLFANTTVMAGLAVAVLAAAACTPGDPAAPATSAATTTAATEQPVTTTVAATTTTEPDDVGPVAAPVRHPVTERSIYFVMTDRFENGDAANDTGGIDGGPLDHGYLPEDTGFYQGGDVAGLTARLPYLADLGVGAIWITPPFTNRTVQGNGTVEGSSAGYHGYWQIDWSRIDPHLGSEDEMQTFIAAAHDLGMQVFFDIVINHTGDVITYEEGSVAYVPKTVVPYRDAGGNEFDDAAVAGSDEFPDLDAAVSFPYTPTFALPADATIKSPEWLNDVTLYHNRGNSSFTGENSLYGDFFGLDDLFTEHPTVVEGMIELYTDVIRRYEIDGVRIDTVKHVNDEFWATFLPAMSAAAAAAGRPDFFMFGEAFTEDPILLSAYTTSLGMDGVLDFIVDGALTFYVADGLDASTMAGAFDRDDWFTDQDSNASMLVKFFGNHDVGRMGRAIRAGNGSDDEDALLRRMELGFDLLFLTRGLPVVYYGDEQGFVGAGGDQQARQSMFPSVTPEYTDQEAIGSDATPGDDNFDPTHPLYRRVADLNSLRRAHRALVTGAQIVHEPAGPVFAFSRIDRDERVEYVVLANNTADLAPATVQVLSPDTEFIAVWGDASPVTSRADGTIEVELPGLSAVMLQAQAPLGVPEAAPAIAIVRPTPGGEIATPRYRIEAELGDRRYAEVTFAVSVDGGAAQVIGTDDAPPYRVYWTNESVPVGATVELIATVDDGSARLRSDTTTATMGDRR